MAKELQILAALKRDKSKREEAIEKNRLALVNGSIHYSVHQVSAIARQITSDFDRIREINQSIYNIETALAQKRNGIVVNINKEEE